jgi:putative transposase
VAPALCRLAVHLQSGPPGRTVNDARILTLWRRQAHLHRRERGRGPGPALDQLTGTWGKKYAAIIRLWENAWEEFIPFLDYDVEIRQVICSTNAIESLNARYRRAVKARGHFHVTDKQGALKCLYLVTRSLDPTGTGRTRWAMRWKPALNAFAITFSDRFPAAETY